MIVNLLNEYHLEFLSFKGGCTGSSESTLVKMPHCWKSHVTAHIARTHQQLCQFPVELLAECQGRQPYVEWQIVDSVLKYLYQLKNKINILHLMCNVNWVTLILNKVSKYQKVCSGHLKLSKWFGSLNPNTYSSYVIGFK